MSPRTAWIAAVLLLLTAAAVHAAGSASQTIEPSTIELGGQARLTITASGADTPAITPPMVPGLEFLAIGQSQQVQITNGVMSSATTVTYQVIPQQAGVFTIPSSLPGTEPLVLTVTRGSAAAPPAPAGGLPGSSAPAGSSAPPAAAQGSASSLPADKTQQGAGGAAFVRLRLAKHDLYVGEMIPVDIQVGARDGMVASINGLPTLDGDAFTLSKLPSNPDRGTEVIDGKLYVVFTYHTALVAVKPGALSLTIDTPLTVRVRTGARPDAGFFAGSGFEDLLNDPAFQNFFGTSMQRDVTVSSAPETFEVQALPTEGRPADFSGAVGQFKVSTELSQNKAGEGDPLTLKMSVSGEGDFDRVSSSMLHDGAGWKAYTPTATFKPSDQIGYRGEKIFEQPLIATEPGERTVPQVAFSWFDPATRRYEQAHGSPLTVSIMPVPGAGPLARTPAAPPSSAAAGEEADTWRPDHLEAGGGVSSLRPYFFEPVFIAIPALLVIAFSTGWLWLWHIDRAPREVRTVSAKPPSVESLTSELAACEAAGNADAFFNTARSALRGALSSKWGISAAEVTTDEVASRLGPASEITRAFVLADEAAYSGLKLSSPEFGRWKTILMRSLERAGLS